MNVNAKTRKITLQSFSNIVDSKCHNKDPPDQ